MKTTRILSLSSGFILILAYLGSLYVFSVTFQNHPKFQDINNLFLKVYYVFNYGVFMSGLPPVILAIYFLILCKAPKSNLWGLLIVGLSILPIHLVVFFSMAGKPSQFVPLQFGELLITFYLIAYWKGKEVEEKFKKELELEDSVKKGQVSP